MNLSIGLIGLPNAGKSTLFNALIKRQLAKVAEYPFTTIEPHEGVIDVPDEKLITLTLMIKPEKSTPTSITFVDIAGLVKGAHKGEGLGNEFLGQIKNVDAILHVVRAFESNEAVHTLGTVDPERDMEIIKTELLLKDLEIVNRMIEQEKGVERKSLLLKLRKELDEEIPIKSIQLSAEERQQVKDLQLLTDKPMFYVLNISEKELGSPKVKKLEGKDFPCLPAGRLVVCAKLESDLIALSSEEQQEYLQSVGVTSGGLEKVVRKAYNILDLINFFTIKGGREVRAWPIKKGMCALDAAGKVHTDMEKGFIKAEVIGFDELVSIGSWHKAHEEGKVRLEGKDYLVTDGDVVEFKFRL